MQFSWHHLPKPFLVLAPMEDVTDTVFRQVISSIAPPDVFFTEFTNVAGMFSAGREVVNQRLKFTSNERPLIAQIWGREPELFRRAAKKLASLGFDGIDINLGCPVKEVIKAGCGAALINEPKLVGEIVAATKQGAGLLPVSVKTRIGVNKISTGEWLSQLLSYNLFAITIHGRTASEQSAVPVHWDEIGKAVELKNRIYPQTIIVGNGDIASFTEAMEKSRLYNVDGVMIGRGVFHNPWVFERAANPTSHLPGQRLQVMKRHIELFEKTWAGKKPFAVLKKYFKIYLSGFAGASDLRSEFMATNSSQVALRLIAEKSGIISSLF